MDNFFQKLRDIQKKERNTGNLTEIDDSFYTDASNYLQELLKMVDNNPLSLEAYQLRDAQRITTEICERREFKIVSTAATNVQKSHDIFKGHKTDSELYDVIPYNTTPEEEEFYRKIVDMMINHRENLMDKIIPQQRSTETKIGFKPKKEVQKSTTNKKETEEISLKSEEPVEPAEVKDNMEKTSKSKGPMLDESQIAMMFGQAPEETFLDENNEPVQVKTDITTPFKPPKPPEEDSVTLQNDTSNSTDKKTLSTITEKDKTSIEDNQDDEIESIATEAEEETNYSDLELVEFKEHIATDILDENEKSYGPFEIKDIVLLPKSIVRILHHQNAVKIIH